jgi:glyoxylase-like metal-dependent hydrolase (beta-lactamase superfamily II)
MRRIKMLKSSYKTKRVLGWLLVFSFVFSFSFSVFASEDLLTNDPEQAAPSQVTLDADVPGVWVLTIHEALTPNDTIRLGLTRYTIEREGDDFTGNTREEQAESLSMLLPYNPTLANFDIEHIPGENIITLRLGADFQDAAEPPFFVFTSSFRPADWWTDSAHRAWRVVDGVFVLDEPGVFSTPRSDRIRPFPSWDERSQPGGPFRLIETSETWFDVYKVPGDVYVFFEPSQGQEVMSFLVIGSERNLLFDTGMSIGNLRNALEDIIAIEGLDIDIDADSRAGTFFIVNSHTHSDHISDNWRFPYTTAYVFDGPFNILTGQTAFERLTLDVVVTYTEDIPMGAITGPNNLMRNVPPAFQAELDAGGGVVTRPGINGDMVALIDDGHIFDLGNRELLVVHTPGHTHDSITLVDGDNMIAFTGDWYYAGPNYVSANGTADLQLYHESAARLWQILSEEFGMDASDGWIFGSHNEPVQGVGIIRELAEVTRRILDGDVTLGFGYYRYVEGNNVVRGNISNMSMPSPFDLGVAIRDGLGNIEWFFESEFSPTGNIRIQTNHRYGLGVVHSIPTVTQDGHTLVPVRLTAYAFGASVDWDDDTREITLVSGDASLTFAIGEVLPGTDVPTVIIDDRAFVEVSFANEFFGADIN